jgi:hypothetical protein
MRNPVLYRVAELYPEDMMAVGEGHDVEGKDVQ